MATFLTADTHFGHANIMRFCKRPFGSADEMNRRLIENWNSVVGPEDTVWHLGDFQMKLTPKEIADVFHSLNGKKHLIMGNHDFDKRGNLMQAIARLPWASEPTHLADIRHGDRRIILSHYAGLTWPGAHKGAFQAFGHSHGGLVGVPGSVDVGVDCQNFTPITVEEFIRQAEETLVDAKTRVEKISASLRERIPKFKEIAQRGKLAKAL